MQIFERNDKYLTFFMTKSLSMNSLRVLKRLKFSRFVVKNKHLLSANNSLKTRFLSINQSINCRTVSNSCHSLPSVESKETIVCKMSSEHIFTNDTPGKSQNTPNIRPYFKYFFTRISILLYGLKVLKVLSLVCI